MLNSDIMRKKMIVELRYGSWSQHCRTHIHIMSRPNHPRLCGGIAKTNWGNAGSIEQINDITCIKCRRKFKQLKKEGYIFEDFYTGKII